MDSSNKQKTSTQETAVRVQCETKSQCWLFLLLRTSFKWRYVTYITNVISVTYVKFTDVNNIVNKTQTMMLS